VSLDGVDANKITVKWKGHSKSNAQKAAERYEIAIDGKKLVAVDADTRLPEQNKKKLSDEALQATNRLRRLLGNAPPLKEVAGMPEPKRAQPQNIAFAPVRSVLSGIASWYGPGFHGNRTANGETYNQNALTAAHKSLPFGTRVRVTHTGTGRSIVVRINDRGPYIGGRIIDLSAAAARVLGMAGSGVAPVRVEVLAR
jgi:rare lipoprotein A